jgi:hypothetical protein
VIFQLPGVFSLERMRGVPKHRREAVKRELRILGENLLLCCATCGELEQELELGRVPRRHGLPSRICGLERR